MSKEKKDLKHENTTALKKIKLKIDDFYGIRNELEIENEIYYATETKKNENAAEILIIFSPNGVGKTSIFKGFQAAGASDYKYQPLHKNEEDKGSFYFELKEKYKFEISNKNKKSKKEIDNNLSFITIANDSLSEIENDIDSALFLEELKKQSVDEKKWTAVKEIEEKIVKKIQDIKQIVITDLAKTIEKRYLPEIFTDQKSNELHKPEIMKVNEILNDNNKYNEEKIKSSIKKLLKINKIIIGNSALQIMKTKDLNDGLEEIIKEAEKLGFFIDKSICEVIENESRESFFGYRTKEQKEFVAIKDAKAQILKQIESKIPEEMMKIISLLMDLGKENTDLYDNIKKLTRENNIQLKSWIDRLKRTFLKELIENFFKAKVKSKKESSATNGDKEETFQELINDYNSKCKDMLNEFQQNVKIINDFFESRILEWYIRIKEPTDFIEKVDIKIFKGDIDKKQVMEGKQFSKYASSGEKQIVLIIAQLCKALSRKNLNKKTIIVLDDVVSSIDSSHMDDFINTLLHSKFEKFSKILLTHNFEFLRSLIFAIALKNILSSIIILDKTKDENNEYSVLKINPSKINFSKEISEFMWTRHLKKLKLTPRFIILLHLIWEWIDCWARKWESNSNNNPKENSFREIFNELAKLRHNDNKNWKEKFYDVLKSLEKSQKNNPELWQLETLRLWITSAKQLKKQFKNDKSKIEPEAKNQFFNFIIEYAKEKRYITEFNSFTEFISHKIILGIAIRHITEHLKIEHLKNDKSNKQIPEKINDKSNKQIPEKINDKSNKQIPEMILEWESQMNLFAHINNFQWGKIAETPLWKIIKIFEKCIKLMSKPKK